MNTYRWGAFWAVVGMGLWFTSPIKMLPSPPEVLGALKTLWLHGGLGWELATSLKLILQATMLSTGISALLSYLTLWRGARPVSHGVATLRFTGLVGVGVPFTLLFGGGHALKLGLLTFGMTTYMTTALIEVVGEIPKEKFLYLRVLGASRIRTFWEVVVRGTLAESLDIVRQNVGMGWGLITAVEGISRAEGGMGSLILSSEKHFALPEVFALVLVVLGTGIVIDSLMRNLIIALCPYRQDKA